MRDIKRLLDLRKKIKRKKPKFSRQDAHKKKSLGYKWRRPKGLHSKMRMQKKGYKRIVKKGHGSPVSVKGFNEEGLKKVMIFNEEGLKNIDNKTQGAIISSRVSLKNKIDILQEAEKNKVKILNIKDTVGFIKEIKEKREKAKEEKEEKKKEKEDKKKAAAKKKEKEEKKGVEEKVLDDEEKKKEEKKEKDKLLTKKQ